MPSLLDTALIAAIVSAAVTALGWYASHWSEKRLESQRRIERIVDVQTALLAEIESNLTRYEEIDLDKHTTDMVRRITGKAQGKNFTPFVTYFAKPDSTKQSSVFVIQLPLSINTLKTTIGCAQVLPCTERIPMNGKILWSI